MIDPLTDEVFEVISPNPGEVIGMAAPQPAKFGYTLFRLAWHVPD